MQSSSIHTSSRIALWLDVDDLRWLAQHLATPLPSLAQDQRQYAERIRFWTLATLHKEGHLSPNQADSDTD
jgi:hypothetical protein